MAQKKNPVLRKAKDITDRLAKDVKRMNDKFKELREAIAKLMKRKK